MPVQPLFKRPQGTQPGSPLLGGQGLHLAYAGPGLLHHLPHRQIAVGQIRADAAAMVKGHHRRGHGLLIRGAPFIKKRPQGLLGPG